MTTLKAQSFIDAASRVASWRHPLLLTHEKPDGDALGSLVAMRAFLCSQGLQPTALLFDPIPARYELFHRYQPLPILGRDLHLSDLDACDAVIVLDTCAYTQLRPIADWLRAAPQPKLAVDHHATRDDLADFYLVDESAAAACLFLYDWALAAKWTIEVNTAQALFIGMAMDTGWFRHSNTDHRLLIAAADLVARGVRPHELYESLFLRESAARVRLQSAAIATLELLAADRAAVMTLTRRAIADAGATVADTEDIVNEPLRIASVVVSLLLVEHDDGVVRASFRSKPPSEPGAEATGYDAKLATLDTPACSTQTAQPDIDVAALAQSFGGGGHRRASGARIPGPLPDVRRRIVESLLERMAQ
jgi:phosphoesterase RecJ-like protein